MERFRVALLQLLPGKSREENLEKGLDACRRAGAAGADLAVFPEMWSTGYDLDGPAERTDGAFVSAFQALAAELDMAVGVTYLEDHAPLPRNTLTVFDRFGRNVLTYAKVHTCDFGAERVLSPGDDFYTAELDTRGGTVKIGAMICYDREFPESARILMLKGAEIILTPNACPMELNRLCQLRGRAFENMTGIATVNYPVGRSGCNGHSTAFDGMAWDEAGDRDMLVLDAGEAEGIFLADFPMDALRAYRRSEVHGNAYRRPGTYGLLTAREIEEPFRRADYRG